MYQIGSVYYDDRKKIERDSFVTHKRIFQNHELIKQIGVEAFISEQNKRILILRDMLENFDDKRSKSFFCLAAAMLPIECLQTAMKEIAAGNPTENKGIDLQLKK